MTGRLTALVLIAAVATTPATVAAVSPIEPPLLAPAVADGSLPPVERRLPSEPSVVSLTRPGVAPGRHGGEMRMLVSQPKDTRMMVVYGYARLVGYDPEWRLQPDLLARVEKRDGREFTLHLRKGHRWSDGHPFTAEDFRFYWEDIANNPEISPGGLEPFLLAEGRPPRFEVVDETTVRYTWETPNPFFLPALAGARPEYIYAPAHVLKSLHTRYRDPAELAALAKQEGQRSWAALFNQRGQQYRNDNPDLPTLEPWWLVTRPPSTRFVFERNAYFHRVDTEGRQLPYVDRVAFSVVNAQLIPAKAAAGDADLQARSLGFENFTMLKQGEKRNGFTVRLWRSARGAELALYPNLNVVDPVWRALLRDVRFRRGLSMSIDRHEINQVAYYGMASEGNDTVLPESPLFEPEYATAFARYDPEAADRLFDEVGLRTRNSAGIRLMPDGRPLEIVVETGGEQATQVAILQLVTDTWRTAGIRLLIKPEQRDLLRNRVFAGQAVMSVWYGLENALPSASTPPLEMAPTSQQQLCWPKWGQYFETRGRAGEPVDDPAAARLLDLYTAWTRSAVAEEKQRLWRDMLALRAESMFTIGTVRNVPQPVVVNTRLRNVPEKGVYNWEPGAFFGVYHPDTFWFDDGVTTAGDTR